VLTTATTSELRNATDGTDTIFALFVFEHNCFECNKAKRFVFCFPTTTETHFFTKPEGAFCVQLSAESNLSVLLMVTQNQFGDECLSLCACKPARTNDNHHSNLKTTGHKIQQH